MITRVGICNINSRYTPNFNGMQYVPPKMKMININEQFQQKVSKSGVIQSVKDIVSEMFPVLNKSYRNMIKSSSKKSAKIYG